MDRTRLLRILLGRGGLRRRIINVKFVLFLFLLLRNFVFLVVNLLIFRGVWDRFYHLRRRGVRPPASLLGGAFLDDDKGLLSLALVPFQSAGN